MATYGELKYNVTAYCKRTLTSDFNINSNADILSLALNNARRYAERIADFHYCETDVFLSIGASGGLITNAYADASVTVAGTLYPNGAGTYTRGGVYGALPFYSRASTVAQMHMVVITTPSASDVLTIDGNNYWFSVDGSGSGSGIEIALLSTDTMAQIATKIAAAVNSQTTATANGASVTFNDIDSYAVNNVAGNFTITDIPVGTLYVLFYDSTAWKIRLNGFYGTNGWTLTTASTNPAGSYTASGTFTGTATVTATTGTIGVKRISDVLLPVAGGAYQPVEYLTNDEFVRRTRRAVGRQAFNSARTLENLGLSFENPLCYQQGQTLYLAPATGFTFPVVAKLSIIRWLAEYTSDSDTDFITERAPDFMLWQAVIEVNKYWKQFAPRQEGNIDEEALAAQRDAALTALLRWDGSLTNGTSTPEERMRQVPSPNVRAEI